MGEVYIDMEYGGEKKKLKFSVIKNERDRKILISNTVFKQVDEKNIPIECTIDTGDARPVSWNRPIKSYKDKEEFEKLVDELEKRGIVEDSTSKWLNPVVIVRKKSGALRFCVDFRKLNDLVTQDNFEIPRIQELMHHLKDKNYFSLIDLKDGFYHIKINDNDKHKTVFYTGKKLMQFTRMPQGFKNSPAIFQKAMNLLFKDHIGLRCLVYIDDILVYGRTVDEHNENLKIIEEIIDKYNLKENKDKRVTCSQKIVFLGYEIEKNKIKPTLIRAQGIMDFKIPNTKRGLQKFPGMINYDRMFLKDITSLTNPLYKMLDKKEVS
jgi:hypothetical protein